MNIRNQLLLEQETSKGYGLFPPQSTEIPKDQMNLDQKLKEATRVYEGYLRRMDREKNDPIESRKAAGDKLSRVALEDAERDVMVLRNQRKVARQQAKEPTFKDWVREVKPDDVGVDGSLSKLMMKQTI